MYVVSPQLIQVKNVCVCVRIRERGEEREQMIKQIKRERINNNWQIWVKNKWLFFPILILTTFV